MPRKDWKFWKKDNSQKDETELTFKRESSTGGCAETEYYSVKAQTSDKALELYDKLREREKNV